jgi:hypothetical protein
MTESLGATLVPYNSGDVVKQLRELLPGGVDASSTSSAANRCATSPF